MKYVYAVKVHYKSEIWCYNLDKLGNCWKEFSVFILSNEIFVSITESKLSTQWLLIYLFTIYFKTMMLHINKDKQTYLNFKSNFPSIRPCFSFVYSSPSHPTLIVFTSFKSAARGLFQFLTLQWMRVKGGSPLLFF
jgi:hypothetical protein